MAQAAQRAKEEPKLQKCRVTIGHNRSLNNDITIYTNLS